MDEETKPVTEENTGESSVAEMETPERLAEVEGEGSKPEVNGSTANGVKKGKPDPFYANKRVTESLKKEVQELKSLVTQVLEAQKQPVSNGTASASNADPVDDIWSNPDKYVEKKIEGKLGEAVRHIKSEKAREDAEQWVLSQDGIDPERDFEELRKLSESYNLNAVAAVNPQKAAELLVKLWKADKGIQKNIPSKNQATSVQGSPASAGGKKVYSKEWVQKLAMNDPQKYEEIKDDLKLAAQEGRIR